jgi:hypothetical protein
MAFIDDYSLGGTIARTPSPVTAPEAWSPMWDVFIPDGERGTLSEVTGEARARAFAGWRTRGRFTAFGEWFISSEAGAA